MKKKNWVYSVLFAASFLSVIGVSTFKAETVSANDLVKTESQTKDISLTSKQVEVSKPMTKDEVIEAISKQSGISKESVSKNIVKKNNARSLTSTSNSTYVVVKAFQDFQVEDTVAGGTAYFYCEITAGGNFRAIKKVIYSGFSHPKYGFSGSLQYGLPDPNRIHYTLNGKLYKNATTTTTGGGSVGVGGVASASLTSSVSSNFVKNVFVTKNVYF